MMYCNQNIVLVSKLELNIIVKSTNWQGAIIMNQTANHLYFRELVLGKVCRSDFEVGAIIYFSVHIPSYKYSINLFDFFNTVFIFDNIKK